MEAFSENTNLEIYADLEKDNWFKKIFPNAHSFDYRDYDSIFRISPLALA